MFAAEVNDFITLLATAYKEKQCHHLSGTYRGSDSRINFLLQQLETNKAFCQEVINLFLALTVNVKNITPELMMAINFLELESRYNQEIEERFAVEREKITGIPANFDEYLLAFQHPQLSACMEIVKAMSDQSFKEKFDVKMDVPDMTSPGLISNMNAAMAAKRFVKWTCVYGAYNRQEDLDKTNKFNRALIEDARKQMTYGNDFVETLKAKASIALTKRAGNCEEQMCLSLLFLISKGVYDVTVLEMDGGDHTFIAIGLGLSSDLLYPNTVSGHAVICDSWANECYPAKLFNTMSTSRGYLYVGMPRICYSFFHDGLDGLGSDQRDTISKNVQDFMQTHLTEMYPDETTKNKLPISLFSTRKNVIEELKQHHEQTQKQIKKN